MFFKIGAPKDFAIFTGRYLCWSLFLTKLQASRPDHEILLFWTCCEKRISCLKNIFHEKHIREKTFREKHFVKHFSCEKRISLNYCTNTVVIKQKYKRAWIRLPVPRIIWCDVSKKSRCEKRKTNPRSWPCELDEERSLLEINCSLWSHKLLWFSWRIYMVLE